MSSVSTCHGKAAIIGPKVPQPLHSGGAGGEEEEEECVRLFITSCRRLNLLLKLHRAVHCECDPRERGSGISAQQTVGIILHLNAKPSRQLGRNCGSWRRWVIYRVCPG